MSADQWTSKMIGDVSLRRLSADDLSMVRAWRNAPKIRRAMFNSDVIDSEEHRAWFDRVSQDPMRRLFIVEDQAGPFGFVQFSGVDDCGISDWGFYVRPNAEKGSGRRLGVAALSHAFTTLQLHKVCGQALAFNNASIRMHEKLGFQREGLFRDHHRVDNSYVSILHFGILHTEWPAASDTITVDRRGQKGHQS